ncbi:MAG TPA: STAS domain-containing protein [Negativicutes bacterium]|nr:STAS domain-containing protein [Negativicutes bacterium]
MLQEIKVAGNTVNVNLGGSMYAIDAAALRDAIQSLIQKESRNFLFDLSMVDYMDSTGLGLFIFLEEELKKKKGTLVLKGLSGRVKVLFERTRLYEVFTILP